MQDKTDEQIRQRAQEGEDVAFANRQDPYIVSIAGRMADYFWRKLSAQNDNTRSG